MFRVLLVIVLLYSVYGGEAQITSKSFGLYVLKSQFKILVFISALFDSHIVTSKLRCFSFFSNTFSNCADVEEKVNS